MIYTTNWTERLRKSFRRVTGMRGEESVLRLTGKTAMDKKA